MASFPLIIRIPGKSNGVSRPVNSNYKESCSSFRAAYTQEPRDPCHHRALKLSGLPTGFDYQTSLPKLHVDHSQLEYSQNLRRLKNTLCTMGERSCRHSLAMIDTIQRLCLEHHFHSEIKEVMGKLYLRFCSYDHRDRDLYEVCFHFRMLRQQGYFVSPSVFNIFQNKHGRFQKCIREDIKGLMELYEASHLSIEGEEILDKARDFSSKYLEACPPHLDNYQGRLVRNTLDHPHHKSFSRFKVKSFLMAAERRKEYWWMQSLLEVARTDLSAVQTMHHDELSQLLKWWRELGLEEELKFARSQPPIWHMSSTALLTDPRLTEERVDISKAISFIYIIDDIFDNYANLEELIQFTSIIERWNEDGIEQLPHFMKSCFKALDNVTNEISFKIYKKHGLSPLRPLRRSWATLCRAFLIEARWFASGHLPSSAEYLRNGIISAGMHVALAHVSFLLGERISEESERRLVDGQSEIVSSAAAILRLWDDLESAKEQNKCGCDGSFLDCYLTEHEGCNPDDARKVVLGMISHSWKGLNQGHLFPGSFTDAFARACLNAARVASSFYG